jgi:hypothetical protein
MALDLRGNVFLGIGARNTSAGLNWLYGGVDVTQLGVAGLKFLRGEALNNNDQVQLRFQAEAGNLDKIPGIGPLLLKLVPHADQADAGAVFRVTVRGNGKGGIEIASIDGFVYADVPNNNGLVNIGSNGKVSPGTKTDQGFTNITTGFKWTPENGLVQTNNDVLNGQITKLFPPRDPNALDINSPVFNGWSVMGITNNDNSNALTPALQNQLGRLSGGPGSRSNQIISGAVGVGQIVNFFNDVRTSLDGKTVAIVKGSPGGIADGQPFSTTGLSVTQGVISTGSPVGVFLRVQGAITATKDGKDDINLFIGGHKIGSTTMRKVQKAGEDLLTQMSNIPGLEGLAPKRTAQASKPIEFKKLGWVGCEKTHKQLIYGTDTHTLQVLVKDDSGKVLGRYSPGTTKLQIADTMANPDSTLYNKGSNLTAPAQVIIDRPSKQGKYKNGDTIGDLPGGHYVTYFETLPGQGPAGGARNIKTHTSTYVVPDTVGPGKDDVRAWVIRSIKSAAITFPDVKLGGASSADATTIKQGWVGCKQTNRQLIMAWAGNDGGKVLVMDDAGTVLATYAQGTTKEQIADTMANPRSVLYGKGLKLDARMSQTPDKDGEMNTIKSASLNRGAEQLQLATNVRTGNWEIHQGGDVIVTPPLGTTRQQAQELLNTLLPPDGKVQQAAKPEPTALDLAIAPPRIRLG